MTSPTKRSPAAGSLNIKALLSVALEHRPRDDVQTRVLDRVAAVTTALEFAKLVLVAPFAWIVQDHLRGQDPEGEPREDKQNDADA